MYLQTMACIIVILAAPDFIALSHSCYVVVSAIFIEILFVSLILSSFFALSDAVILKYSWVA